MLKTHYKHPTFDMTYCLTMNLSNITCKYTEDIDKVTCRRCLVKLNKRSNNH